MRQEVIPAQFAAGLVGLGLLRTWPFLDAAGAEERLDELEALAADRQRGTLEIDDVSTGYEAWAETYDTLLNPLLAAEEPAMRTALVDIPRGRALDVACGTGRLTRLLRSLCFDVHSVDGSEAMLAQARRADPDGHYAAASLDALPFDDNAFDLVVCGLALTHVPSLGGPIAELARVLEAGGHLVISEVHPIAVATGAHAFLRDAHGARRVVRNQLHWHSDYVRAFGAAGLVVHRCVEPLFTETIYEAFMSKASPSELKHLIGLPYVLVWDCRKVGLDGLRAPS